MKKVILFLSLLAVVFCSCTKDGKEEVLAPSLMGTWRMIQVIDNTTGLKINKPASVTGEVELALSFTTNTTGMLNGHTPTNTFSADFTVEKECEMKLPTFHATKVGESWWGRAFLDNISTAQDYFLDHSDRLHITCVKKTLVFKKL